ncbi:trypsin-like peptidase domain-containing protein [Nocardia sp. NPDC049220]|uniref:S1C family serine protease n=1 Tax=Nocardia sp. NPDC049220 TaxID=3155273 RepID=UPI0033C95FD0
MGKQAIRARSGGGRVLVMIVTILLVVAAFLDYRGEPPSRTGAEASAAIAPAPSNPLDPVSVTAAMRPALVNISASTKPFGLGAAGSGIVLSADGEVLTSHHVIKGADTVTVTDVGNGKIYDAVVLGYDSGADIAVLDLSAASELTTATLGNSADLRVHDEVMAIGNAGGTGGAPTGVQGRITNLDSAIVALNVGDLSQKALSGMLEVAAGVTSGQSGGALVDRKGAVVGVIAAASGESTGADGHPANGYAVPIDTAMRVVHQIRSGTPTDTVHVGPTATLGVITSNALPTGTGARVDAAVHGMPAHTAGLGTGDVITSVDGRVIDTAHALRVALNGHRPHDTVRLTVTGAGGQRTLAVVLAVGPPN